MKHEFKAVMIRDGYGVDALNELLSYGWSVVSVTAQRVSACGGSAYSSDNQRGDFLVILSKELMA